MPRGRKKKVDNNSNIDTTKSTLEAIQKPTENIQEKKRGRPRKEKKFLYMVYWSNCNRKAIVVAENEEEAKVKARRFAGNYKDFNKIEFLGFEQKD